MIGSLFTAITGLQSFQQDLNVISNDIANVNTVGYKTNETIFESMISQTLRGAAAPTTTTGGSNPNQIGLGVQLSAIDPIFTQGGAQTTGKPTDMMIQGNGFFVVQSNGAKYYTRDGGFDRDATGDVVNPATGMTVMGYQAQGNPPTINYNAPLSPINIPNTYASFSISSTGIVSGITSTGTTTTLGQVALATFPNPSGLQAMGNNLYNPTLNSGQSNILDAGLVQFSASTAVPVTSTNSPQVPSLVVPTTVLQTNFPTGITVASAAVGANTTNSVSLNSGNPVTSMQLTFSTTAGGVIATPKLVINGTVSALVGALTAGPPTTVVFTDPTVGTPTAGNTLTISIPNTPFTSASGLQSQNFTLNLGGSLGATGIPGQNGIGTITPGALEMANVDLSREFSNMIIAERGFQANSKTITTSDSVLLTLVNMKSQG